MDTSSVVCYLECTERSDIANLLGCSKRMQYLAVKQILRLAYVKQVEERLKQLEAMLSFAVAHKRSHVANAIINVTINWLSNDRIVECVLETIISIRCDIN